jgi:hypothetical protein
MMMLPDKKKIASVIVDKMKPKSEEPMEEIKSENNESDYSMAKEDAAKKMLSAFEKKDSKMLVAALQDFMDMCEMEEDESEDESEMES